MLLRGEGPGDANAWITPELKAAALRDAIDELRETLGEDPATWTWGAIHQATFAHPLAAVPGLEELFIAAQVPLGGDEQTVNQAGMDSRDGYAVSVIPSWRAVWDLADLNAPGTGVVPTGVSGNPASPHWNDQTNAWLDGDQTPRPGHKSLALRPPL